MCLRSNFSRNSRRVGGCYATCRDMDRVEWYDVELTASNVLNTGLLVQGRVTVIAIDKWFNSAIVGTLHYVV